MGKKFTEKLLAKPGRALKLNRWDPNEDFGFSEAECEKRTEQNVQRIFEMQYRMAAENKHSLLVVLQAMDAGGKDGTIRRVMRGLNPQGVHVTSFKSPTSDELQHDFLWRVHKVVPGKGEIGIFNRSHYEDVLIARVRNLVPRKIWAGRYAQINSFEHILTDNGTTIRKFFLHVSKDEQKRRFEERLKDPKKHWKFNPGDIKERALWDEYQQAYRDALHGCSTRYAPWYIIPANKKWFRDMAISEILADTMEKMKLKYPAAVFDLSDVKID